MTPEQKLEILKAVASSGLPAKEALMRLDVAASTYCRWKAAFEKQGIQGLRDRSPYKGTTWNQVLPQEAVIVETLSDISAISTRNLKGEMSDDHRAEDHQEQAGAFEVGRDVGECVPCLQGDGILQGQLLPVQAAV